MITVEIPDIHRPEWGQIITGEIEHTYDNYVFQTQLHQLQKDVRHNRMTISDAATQLYELCVKYSSSVESDLHQIFDTLD